MLRRIARVNAHAMRRRVAYDGSETTFASAANPTKW